MVVVVYDMQELSNGMAQEHKLSFTLLSDELAGVVKVTRARWSEIIYRFPRTAMKETSNVAELQNSGIYFLLGQKQGRPVLYVGQAQNVYRRLQQHSGSESKVFWIETLVVTSVGDACFNAAHLNYLENHFHELCAASDACEVDNSMPPSAGSGIDTIRQEMDECIAHTRVIFNLMGYRFMEKSQIIPAAVEKVPAPPEKPGKQRSPRYDFYEMGLKDGDVLVYEDGNPAHRQEVQVCGSHQVKKGRRVMTPHAFVQSIQKTKNVYAFAYLSRNGVKLSKLYNDVYKGGAPERKGVLYCVVADGDAQGVSDGKGITVLKGSRICSQTRKSCSGPVAKLRSEVISKSPDCILRKDYRFTSLSAAANFVGGCALNGKLYWKRERPLRERKPRKS